MKVEFGCLLGSNVKPEIQRKRKVPTIPFSKLSLLDKKQILDMRLKGRSYAEIEKMFNITSGTIWAIQKDAGYVYPRNIPKPKPEREQDPFWQDILNRIARKSKESMRRE